MGKHMNDDYKKGAWTPEVCRGCLRRADGERGAAATSHCC